MVFIISPEKFKFYTLIIIHKIFILKISIVLKITPELDVIITKVHMFHLFVK